MMPFSGIHISQGSVATCLKRDGIFKHEFIANLLPSTLVKNFENRIIVEVMDKSLVSCFLTHGVYPASCSMALKFLIRQLLKIQNASLFKRVIDYIA